MNSREAMKLEALGDLRACLEQAKELGCIEVIDGADAHLEIGALQELSLRHVTPPILLFQNIKGYPPAIGWWSMSAPPRSSSPARASSWCRATASIGARPNSARDG